tara:strand:- start:152 stop:526 length:375 start_codon:yes stop_codon:yes gene_type:complete
MNSFNVKTHPEGSRLANGTSLTGYIDIGYSALVELFGDPFEGDGYKVDAEWNVEFVDEYDTTLGFVTIYNYKDGKNYLAANGLNVEDIRDWHIGSKSNSDLYMLEDFLDAADVEYKSKSKLSWC